MKLIKTVKRYVSGSDKLFDVLSCKVSNVDIVKDRSDRKTISVDVEGVNYKGLYSKKVYEYLCEQEDQEDTLVVMWQAPKGDYMLCYLWKLWEEQLDGSSTDYYVKEPTEEPESFLYLWVNRENDKKYLGKHKGTLHDSYVCSSDAMKYDFFNTPEKFIRTILAQGTDAEMSNLETTLIKALNASSSPLFYNLANNRSS